MHKHHTLIMTPILVITASDDRIVLDANGIVVLIICSWHTIGLQSRHFLPIELRVDDTVVTVVVICGMDVV